MKAGPQVPGQMFANFKKHKRQALGTTYSQAAIDQLPVKTFSAEDLDGLWHDQCLVCHDSFEVGSECMSMPCDHTFHSTCLKSWLEMHSTCPVCRREIEVCARMCSFELSGFAFVSPQRRRSSKEHGGYRVAQALNTDAVLLVGLRLQSAHYGLSTHTQTTVNAHLSCTEIHIKL